ncbi:MAG: hypothetical protein ACLGI2_06385 [Acidimicrobiia bacterium]
MLRRLLNGPAWGVAAGGLVAAGGKEGRKAAIRGGACYAVCALVVNFVLRPLLGKRLPVERGLAGCDVSFTAGAAQEMPAAAAPLAVLAVVSHVVDLRGSDRRRLLSVLAADVVGVAVGQASNLVWPSKMAAISGPGSTPRPGVVRHQGV